MSGSMKCKAAVIGVLSIGGLPALLGQQSSGTGTTLSLHGVVSALGGVPNSTASTVMQFTADPSSGGGDMFDIVVSDPRLAVSLIRPDGTSMSASNAANFGCTSAIYPDGWSGSLPLGRHAGLSSPPCWLRSDF